MPFSFLFFLFFFSPFSSKERPNCQGEGKGFWGQRSEFHSLSHCLLASGMAEHIHPAEPQFLQLLNDRVGLGENCSSPSPTIIMVMVPQLSRDIGRPLIIGGVTSTPAIWNDFSLAISVVEQQPVFKKESSPEYLSYLLFTFVPQIDPKPISIIL